MSRTAPTLFCALVCVVAFPAVAQANTQTVRDGNDRPGSLDIRSASATHVGSSIRHTITTFGRWRTSAIGPSTPNFLAVGLDLRGNARAERFILFSARGGRARALLIAANGSFVDRLPASRPNGRSVSALVPRDLLDGAGGYAWYAVSLFELRNRGILDFAPNRRIVFHDVLAPTIRLLSFPEFSTDTSPDIPFSVRFAIEDRGRSSGGVRLELQRRLVGSPGWQVVRRGRGEGTKDVAVPGEEGTNYLLRVVARDRHENVRASAVRDVAVPLDDRNAVFAAAYSAGWTQATGGQPFLNTLMSTSTVGSTFTYTFTGSRVHVLAPGGSPGLALITVDGGGAQVDLSNYVGDRVPVFGATGLDPGTPSTIVITHQSGTFRLDGLVIR